MLVIVIVFSSILLILFKILRFLKKFVECEQEIVDG